MRDTNIIVLHGRLTRDAELKYTNNQTPVCNFTIANNTAKDGEVNFINCVVWAKYAEAMAPLLLKGKAVNVEGELRQQRWEKDGVKHSTFNVQVNSVQITTKKEA